MEAQEPRGEKVVRFVAGTAAALAFATVPAMWSAEAAFALDDRLNTLSGSVAVTLK